MPFVPLAFAVLLTISCASVAEFPDGSSSTHGVCVRVTNDSDEFLKVTLQPGGQVVGRVQPARSKVFRLGSHSLGSVWLEAVPAVGQGTDRYSPRFSFGASMGWHWTIGARIGIGYTRKLEDDLWTIDDRYCQIKKVRHDDAP